MSDTPTALQEFISYRDSSFPVNHVFATLNYMPNYTGSCHWHRDMEIVLINSGEMQYYINGQIYHLPCGSAVVILPKQLHFAIPTRQIDCTFYVLFVKEGVFSAEMCAALEQDNPFGICLSPNDGNQQIDAIAAIRDLYEYCKVRDRRIDSFKSMMLNLLQHLSLTELKKQQRQWCEMPTELTDMLQFIKLHYDDPIDVHQIAKSGNVSRSTCHRLFQKVLQQSPVSYLNNYRVQQSMKLLLNTDLPTGEIAFQCGFNSQSYYTNIFKKVVGKLPSEYRKNRI